MSFDEVLDLAAGEYFFILIVEINDIISVNLGFSGNYKYIWRYFFGETVQLDTRVDE